MGRNKLTNVTKLSREGHDDETPAWSPDHKRIALSRDRHIWTVNSDGTDGQRVTRSANEEGSPEWSPVGDGRIAFDRETNEKQIDVWLRYRDGREENLTFSPTVTGSNPGWSPDGRRIVFQRQTKLWLMRAVPGAQPQQVPVSVSGTIVHPSWSPDGLQIAFTLRASEHGANPCSKDRSDIWVVSPKGRRLRNLTRGRRKKPDNAAWSPESKRLVFADCDGLWLVGRNGERLESLRRGKNLDTPAWAP